MPTHVTSLFTPTEAAFLTQCSVKTVNNAIDRKVVPTVAGSRSGHATRLLDLRALMALALERRLVDRFVPEARREVFDALVAAPRNRVSLAGGFVTIDLRAPRQELASALLTLRRARAAVISTSDTMGGDPVFCGTLVPVHTIAALLRQGRTEAELLHDYPRLTAAMVQLAPIYAAAYPLRGRRRAQPWHDHQPIQSTRRKLAAVGAG